MVEKVSEKNVKLMVNIDALSHDRDLLKCIAKKKKNIKPEDNIVSAALFTSATLTRFPNVNAPGGGLQHTARQAASLSNAQGLDFGLSEKGERLRRRVVSGAADLSAITKPYENKVGEIKASASKIGTPLEKGDSLRRHAITPAAEFAAIAKPSEDRAGVMKLSATSGHFASGTQETVALQHIMAAPTVNVTNVNLPAIPSSGAETGRQQSKQHQKEEGIEVRTTFMGPKPPEILASQLPDTTPQNKTPPALQPSRVDHPELTAAKPGSEIPVLEMNYSFQRWSGDHSVKVMVPTDVRRESAVTLLPSDTRAADVLARNMGQLTNLTPDLLKPSRDHDDQQQQRRQQQQQDEEQE